jgi:hypothetical protein
LKKMMLWHECYTTKREIVRTKMFKKKLEDMLEGHKTFCYTQIVKRTTRSCVAYWNCCRESQQMVSLTRILMRSQNT